MEKAWRRHGKHAHSARASDNSRGSGNWLATRVNVFVEPCAAAAAGVSLGLAGLHQPADAQIRPICTHTHPNPARGKPFIAGDLALRCVRDYVTHRDWRCSTLGAQVGGYMQAAADTVG
jgi:hypothetical protein